MNNYAKIMRAAKELNESGDIRFMLQPKIEATFDKVSEILSGVSEGEVMEVYHYEMDKYYITKDESFLKLADAIDKLLKYELVPGMAEEEIED